MDQIPHIDIDIPTLRLSNPQSQVQILRTALSKSSSPTSPSSSPSSSTSPSPSSSPDKAKAITQTLLSAIQTGSLPPCIIHIWLCISPDPHSIHLSLTQRFSLAVRNAGIVAFGRALRDASRWRYVWDALGGVRGVVELLNGFSVRELGRVCVAIVRAAKASSSSSSSSSSARRDGAGDEQLEERREEMTALLKALLPDVFPETQIRTPDPRPLAKYYRRLLPACSQEVVMGVLLDGSAKGGDWDDVREGSILRLQMDTVKKLIVKSLLKGTKVPAWLSRWFWESSPGKESLSCLPWSMGFSMEVMRLLVDRNLKPEGGIRHFFLENVVRRLTRRRVLKGKPNAELEREAIDLAVAYLRRNPKAATPGELLARYGLVHLVSIRWSRGLETFDGPLAELLSMLCSQGKDVSLSAFVRLLEGMERHMRYDYLRSCFRLVASRDIESESDLKDMDISWLSYTLLQDLDTSQAVSLFQRLRAARGDVGLIDTGPYKSVLCTSATYASSGQGDACLTYITLLTRNGEFMEAEALARAQIQERRKKAASSSDQQQRAWYARSAIHYATASGSRDCVNEIYAWAHRFVRDPLTCATLYGQYTREFKDLICGVPQRWDGVDLARLKAEIAEANAVLRLLFNTACLGLREPSFAFQTWSPTLKLFRKIVHRRIMRLRRAKGIIDSDELYRAVWEDTVRLLIDVEKLGLTAGYERLELNCMGGILSFQTFGGKKQLREDVESPCTYRFLDELARARDELWREVRPRIYPAAASLPEPYLRGLPIQVLTTPYEITVSNLDEVAPYIARRANAAVFLNQAQAAVPFPQDDEGRAAIGNFIDSYGSAVRMLVPKELDVEEKKRRIERIWRHICIFSRSRMSEEETVRYWRDLPGIFDDDLKDLWPSLPDPYKHFADVPVVPTVEEPSIPEEWNPLPPPTRPDLKERKLEEVTYLDMSKDISRFSAHSSRITDHRSYFLPSIPAHSFKDHPSGRGRGTNEQRKSLRTRILASPFPSERDVRFPALYLDAAFLSREHEGTMDVIEHHLQHVPPTLLAQVARNTLDTLSQSDPEQAGFINLENKAFTLLALLSKSDRPGLATDMAVETILQRPEASSWHRSLLSPRIFRRLSASESRQCFVAFENAIIAKLDEQAQAKKAKATLDDEEKEPTPDTKSEQQQQQEPYVKVTTVKFLAQLLQGSRFVPEDFAIDVLTRLAQKASHVDIKQAILSSLLQIYKDASPSLAKGILVALEEHFIPLIGTLDERRPITEEAWTAAEATLTPPEVDLTSAETTPMLTAVLGFLGSVEYDYPRQKPFLERIVFPILDGLKQEMKRWLTIFLASVSARTEDVLPHLPLVPRSLDVWVKLFRESGTTVPQAVLDEYVGYLLFCISPSPAVVALNERLMKADPNFKAKPHVQTWLSLYNRGIEIVKAQSAFHYLFDLDENGWATQRSNQSADASSGEARILITASSIKSSILTLFAATLRADSPHYAYVAHLLQEFGPTRYHYGSGVRWKASREVVEEVIRCVEDFERGDKGGGVPIVPDTHALRLALLSYPTEDEEDEDEEQGEKKGNEQNKDDEGREKDKVKEGHNSDETATLSNKDAIKLRSRDDACHLFAGQIAAVVDDMIDAVSSAGIPYHGKLTEVKKCFAYMMGVERIYVSLWLGRHEIPGAETAVSAESGGDSNAKEQVLVRLKQALLVELAAELLKVVRWNWGVTVLGNERRILEKRVDEMLERWRKSSDERIRRLGYTVANPCVEVAKKDKEGDKGKKPWTLFTPSDWGSSSSEDKAWEEYVGGLGV
ncbi:uncharacterized protein EI97DRAFT_482233 [Westerdykella ornata]|uniref:Uncharacterized protein n=1 Tax=Westerdykella ornata TaxID=318751 RepID=A0A6A6JTM9_WESOR|nr:uncharacterized protein EI97DRAFT_482233 [Westerdykella ornata]KAF2279594.1 hypothetical protein EI97DRAFT_482233 [Westerdykella ornata]